MRLRLLKVIVQPIFAADDGENLTEQAGQPVTVAPADWPDYPAALERLRAEAEQKMGPVTDG